MTVFSRLFGKSPAADASPAAGKPDVPSEPPPPDPVARAREEEASLTQAIAAGDRAAVGRWVIDGSSTRIRQAAAQAITDLDQLRELIRATRGGNDKNVYRILTARRDSLLAAMRGAQQLQADLDGTAAAIARHADRPYDALYAATIEQLETRWRALAAHAKEDVRLTVARQLARAHEVLEHHRQAVEADAERKRAAALAAGEARRQRELEAQAAAAAAAEQARLLEAERQAVQAKLEADAAEVRRLVGLLRQAQAALDHGGTARAARLRDAIKEKLGQAPALPAWFERQLQQVDARIEELKDWKTFRVVPKRSELLQQMQSLIGAELSPEELARQIRRLRDEWRTLNRGAGEDPTPELQQFEDAAARAYEPCREHFARQAEIRRENQARREALLERLAAFAAEQSGEQSDFGAIHHALIEARREWQQYAPVDQSVVRPLQARFRAVLDELQSRLDAEYARNVQTKRDLIARAAGLVNLEDTRQAIEEAKTLQRTWKTVGVVPWKQDNALWEEFRRHCDAVFERSSHELAAHAAALEAGHARAAALCEEAERISGLGGEEFASAAERLQELRAEFEALELPRASARELRQRFSRATARCNEALRRHRAEAARRAWTDLFEAAGKVREYALAVALGKPTEECDALRASATASLNKGTVPFLQKGTLPFFTCLEKRMAGIAAGDVAADFAANEAALRLLCVRAELTAGLETPPEDLELRREYQMQRLVASMGRGERPAPGDLDALALEWVAVGPVDTAVYDELFARFERCRQAGGR